MKSLIKWYEIAKRLGYTGLDSRLTDDNEVWTLSAGRSLPQADSWYSFLLEAELTPGPQLGWNDVFHWKIQ
jgi:hypothetical protein